MIGDAELEHRLQQVAQVFVAGVEPPARLHAGIMDRLPRPARVRTLLVRELALAAALLVFVALLGFGASKLHKSPPNTVKPTPHAKSGVIPWAADPMVLFASSAEVMNPADAANRIARTATAVGTVLVPQSLGADYQAQLVVSSDAFTIDYVSTSAEATISLSTPGAVSPANQRGISTRPFRGVTAQYRIEDAGQSRGPRSLSWLEPGNSGSGTSYSLMSDGLSEADFWNFADSLQVASLPALRPCQASDLHAVLGHPNGAGGQVFNSLYFTNHGATACRLLGTPNVSIETTTGRILALPRASTTGTATPPAGPVDLPADSPDADPLTAPSVSGVATLIFSMWDCPANPAIRRVLIALPNNGGTLSLPGAGVAYSAGGACDGGQLAEMDVAPFTANAPLPVYLENAPLAITVKADATPHAGAHFQYDVTLTNTSGAPFHFHECPSYTEYAIGIGPKTLENYSLNCRPVGWIAPGAAVTFAMVLQIPAGTAGESGRLQWEMRSPYGTAQGSAPIATVS